MNSFQFVIICDDLVMNSVLETKSQVMHFPPNDFIQKILRQFSRARLRNKNWNTICNHVSFWVRSNFFWQGSQGISNSDRQKNTITTLHILYCICALHVHHVTVKKKSHPSQKCTTTHVFRSPSDKQGTRGCMIYYLQCMN